MRAVECCVPLAYWYVTGVLVLGACLFGMAFVTPSPGTNQSGIPSVWDAAAAWDGWWFARIVERGYEYDPERRSSIAFFPAYPAIAAGVVWLSGVDARIALAVVSQTFLAGAFVLLYRYVALGHQGCSESSLGGAGTVDNRRLASFTVLSLGLLPTSFYLRMSYSEPMFLFLAVLQLTMIRERRPLWAIALVGGAATATRLVGIALLLPLILRCWEASTSWRGFVLRVAAFGMVGCWGLAAFVLFCWARFDEPFAFVKVQQAWSQREPPGLPGLAWQALRFEPLLRVYDPDSICYWGLSTPPRHPLFNMMFANPLYFVAGVTLIAVGSWRQWLDRHEVAISAALIGIPYFLQGYRTCMASQARFLVVVFPIYVVVARILEKAPPGTTVCIFSISTSIMLMNAVMFVCRYWFY